MRALGRAADGLRKVAGLVLPMLARAGDFAGAGRAGLGALRLLALAVLLVILGAINVALDLRRFLEPPVKPLGYLWLPILFLLLDTLCWLLWWLWTQAGPDRDEASFPDVDEAWQEAVRSLERSGIGLRELPVFLVLGRPRGPEEALFDGAELQLVVRGQPGRDRAPLRVYAGRDAIFVTCAGASTLGLRPTALEASDDEEPSTAPAEDGEEAAFRTFGAHEGPATGPEAGVSILSRARTAGRGPDRLLDEELRALGRLAADDEGSREAGPPGPSSRPGPPGEGSEVRTQEARLRHLGRLIARDRRPFCPINGVLMLIPVAATNGDRAATRVGLLCRRDLAAVREGMQVRCPVFALVCDLEDLPGFREMIGRLPEDQRRRRMGQRFPLVPDVEPSLLPEMIEGGVRWIAYQQLPSRIDSLWRVEVGGEVTMADAVAGNVRLYQFLHQVRRRHRRLGRLLARAVITDGRPSAMLGGCYLAGTGPDLRADQAFIPGVFRRLIESQDFVSWTPELLARERLLDRKVRVGYLALGGLIALALALGAYALYLAIPSRG